jgi:hypothetical protein
VYFSDPNVHWANSALTAQDRQIATRTAPPPPQDRLMFDAALALFVMVVALSQQRSASSRSPGTHSLGMTFAALFALTLTYRRRAPFAVLGIMVVALLAWSLSGVPTSGAGIPIVVALYSVAAYRPARVSLTGLALAIACVFAVRTNQGIPADMVETVAIMAGACYFGSNVGLRRRQGEALAAYAAELAATREENRPAGP